VHGLEWKTGRLNSGAWWKDASMMAEYCGMEVHHERLKVGDMDRNGVGIRGASPICACEGFFD
jgi:hypothetical protein